MRELLELGRHVGIQGDRGAHGNIMMLTSVAVKMSSGGARATRSTMGDAVPNYLTPEGAKKIAEELRELATVERPRVVAEVSDAAAQGDRSENAEYIYGKKRLREIDRRIRLLTKKLDAAVVVRSGEVQKGEVRFGAMVEVRDEEGKTSRYRIVGPDEADPAKGSISFHSPLGKSLMKRKVGDAVVVERPAGALELEIVAIAYE